MDTSEFTFVKELPTSRRSYLERFADALKARRGEWAVWPRELKRPQLKYFPVGDFEAQKVGNAVYVRFVGE